MSIPTRGLCALALALAAGCTSQDPLAAPPADPEPQLARFTVDLPENPVFLAPADAAASPNPFFPLVPGAEWTFQAETEDAVESTVDVVTGDTRMVDGVETTVLRDAVYLEGELVELTFDWLAQDTEGHVWYLGESSCEWEPGDYTTGDELQEDCGPNGDPGGSWEAGEDGAEAGIIMWSDPLALRGKTYRQEYYRDEAEDMAKVLRGDLAVTVPAGSFTGCVETMDWTPLEPGARERKTYCPGYGMVLEVTPREGRARNELIAFEGLPVG